MSKVRFAMLSVAATLGCGLANVAAALPDYDHNFLSNYDKLVATPLPNNATDLMYTAPGVFDRIGKYTALMIDQPEILISPKSEYDGAKPADLAAIAEQVRKDLIDALKAGGYGIVESPGPNVLYLKSAITDLMLKRKKRRLLAYTPVGFVVKAGVDATRDMMEKYDIMGDAAQGQVMDSQSGEVLGEFVALRGNNGQRITFDQMNAEIKGFASRLRCRLDNTHVPADKRIDCLDPAARAAREALGPVLH
jgi:Protein of unknown function (DUF3313)